MRHDHCDYVDVHREDELWQLDSIPKWWDSLFQICCLIEISLFWPRWWPSTILQKSSPLFLLHLVLWPLGSKIPTCKKLEKRTNLWTGAFELQAWILELWFTTRLLLHDVGLLLGWFADSTSRAFGIHVSYHGRHFQWGSSGGKVWVKKECSSSWCGRGPRNECVMSVEYIYILEVSWVWKFRGPNGPWFLFIFVWDVLSSQVLHGQCRSKLIRYNAERHCGSPWARSGGWAGLATKIGWCQHWALNLHIKKLCSSLQSKERWWDLWLTNAFKIPVPIPGRLAAPSCFVPCDVRSNLVPVAVTLRLLDLISVPDANGNTVTMYNLLVSQTQDQQGWMWTRLLRPETCFIFSWVLRRLSDSCLPSQVLTIQKSYTRMTHWLLVLIGTQSIE